MADLVARMATEAMPNCGAGPCTGGCIEACLASITGIEAADIPCTDQLHQDEDNWVEATSRALHQHGWGMTWVDGKEPAPRGWCIAAGPDGEDGSSGHAVVAYDGEPVYDPSGDIGLQEVTTWYLVYPVVTIHENKEGEG